MPTSEPDKHRRLKKELLLNLADLVMIQLSFLLAILLFHNLKSVRNELGETLAYFLGLPNLAITAYWLVLINLSRFVKGLFPQSLYGEILRIFNVVSLGVVLIIFAVVDFSDPHSFFSTSKFIVFTYWVSLVLLLSLNRMFVYRARDSVAAEKTDEMITPLLVPRRLLIVLVDLIIIAASYYSAFLIRFEGAIPAADLKSLEASLPVVIILRFSMLLYFRLYSGYYRYASISDLTQILKAVTAGSVLIGIPTYFLGFGNIPRGVFVIDWLLLVVLLGGSRFLLRAVREMVPGMLRQGKRTFVIGAGSAGEMMLRELRKSPMGYRPVGLIDDDAAKQGMRIHGVTVLGNSHDMGKLADKHNVTDAIIAIPSATGKQMREMIEACRRAHLDFKSLPPLREIIHGQVNLSQVRNIKVEDLLGRTPVRLDNNAMARFLHDKRVLVTGGGGSIGAEICRQVLEFAPAELVIVERAENRLYEVMLELQSRDESSHLIPHVADINDPGRMDQIFSEQQPQVVFHAAAYKQVPLMELFPEEAVRNNVFGTRTLVELADKHQVDAFVMISTDKAVRPASVMGATKRIAEILVQCFARRSNTSYMTVRFGNVLGSDGSVVPIFQRQIEAGGPVTVTHPDMTRYFMTIQEASRLVMQAAALGRTGDIMVLNMGEPVRIVDLAKAMITLAGGIPDEGIKISFIGLRPGEKLSEELFDEEGLTGSDHENILVARATEYDWTSIDNELQTLHELTLQRNREKILEKIREVLPTFRADNATVESEV